MQKSNNKQEDERREAEGQTRMGKTHGGRMVESVSPDELESFNDPDCKHKLLVRDPTETEFNAFVCTNPKCNEVLVYSKDK